MDASEPTERHLDEGRASHLRGDPDLPSRNHERWKAAAEQIEHDMADAVERAAAMGDSVEPSLSPDEPAPGVTPAEERDSVGDPEGVGYDRASGEAEGR